MAQRDLARPWESCYESLMIMALEGLPDDLDGLREAVLAMHAELADKRAELAAERAERQRLEEQNERLSHFIRQLQRMRFGRRSEKTRSRPAEPGTRRPRAGGRRKRG